MLENVLHACDRVVMTRGRWARGSGRRWTIWSTAALTAVVVTVYGGPTDPARAALPAGGMAASAVNTMFNTYGDAGGHWTGADGTTSLALPDGRLAWFFSDSFLGTVNPDHTRPNTTPLISNTIVVQDGTTLGPTITGGTAASPRPIVTPSQKGEYYWVGDGVVEGGVAKVLYNRYRPTTGGGSLDFVHTGTALVTFNLPALTVASVVDLPVGPAIAWGSAVLVDGGFTYIYGTSPAPGNMSFGYVARVAVGSLGGTWQYWSGSAWVASESAAARLLSGVETGFSVQKVGTQYVLVTHEANLVFDSQFVAYTATTPNGPFTGPTYLYTAPERTGTHIVYDAKLHPALATSGKLLMSYNVNSLTVADNYADASLYRPRFVDVTWPPPAPGAGRPAAPTGVTASGSNSTVTVSWTAVSGATSYRIYQKDITAGQSNFARRSTVLTTATGNATSLISGHTYQFKATAFNANGESNFSATVSVTPQNTTPVATAIRGANASGSIANSYTVLLKGTGAQKERISDYAQQLLAQAGGGTLKRVMPNAVGGFTATMTQAQAVNLAAHPDVDFVEQDATVSQTGTQTNPPDHLDRIDQRSLPLNQVYNYPNTGAARVYVVDSGVRATHVQFGGRVEAGRNVVNPALDTADCQGSANPNGHGTGVASLIAGASLGVAKSAVIVPVKVAACSANGLPSYISPDITDGIDWAIGDAAGRPAVINISLKTEALMFESATERAVTKAVAAGITVVTGAGNEPKDACLNSPARLGKSSAGVITAGASAVNDAVWSQSAFGSCVNLYAPGVSVPLASAGSDSGTWVDSGTSYSAPQVAGAAAIVLTAHPGYSPESVKTTILDAATTGKLTALPAGSPDKLLFIDSPPTVAPTLTASARTDGTVGLSWTAVNQQGIQYLVSQQDVTAGEPSFTQWTTPIVGATTAVASSLLEGHTYNFVVAAANGAGTGPNSNVATAVAHLAPPPAPTGLTATPNSDGTVTLNWASLGANIWYWVYQKDLTAGETVQTRLPLPATTPTVTAGILKRGHLYEFNVSGINAGGEGPQSLPAQATTLFPQTAPPSALVATPGDGQVQLSWTASPTPDVWYWVYQKDVTAGEPDFVQLPYPVTTCCTMSPGFLINGHTYQYKVTATGQGVESAASNVVSVVPQVALPGQVTGLTAAAQTDGTIKLTWTAPGPNVYFDVYQKDISAGQTGFTKLPLPVTTCCTFTAGLLTQNDLYEFKVAATNAAGSGPLSAPAQATAHYNPPAAPTNLRGTTAGSSTINLDWDPPSTESLFYWIYTKDVTAGGAFVKSAFPTTATNQTVSPLINGHQYQFKVTAENAGGEGPASLTISITPVGTVPAPPTALSATAGNGQVTLNWTASSTAGVLYVIYQRDSTKGQSWAPLPLPTSSTSATVGFLTNGDTYQFKVTASGGGVESAPSNVVSAVPLPPLPAAPTGLTASAGDGRVTLNWTASSTPSVYYWIEYQSAGGSWLRLPDPLSTCCNFTVSFLTNGTTYNFRVRATNLAGDSAPSGTASARPLPPLPGAPSSLTASAGNGQVSLSWAASATASVYYWIEMQSQGGSWQRLTYPTTCCSFTAKFLSNGTTYSFRVRATNLAGDSAPTNVASARPMPPIPSPPSNLRATASANGVSLSWNATTTPQVYYRVYLRNLARTATWTSGPAFITGTSAFVGLLWPGDLYEFKVVAENLSGESSASNFVSTRIPYALGGLICRDWVGVTLDSDVFASAAGGTPAVGDSAWVQILIFKNNVLVASIGHTVDSDGFAQWRFPTYQLTTNLVATWQGMVQARGPNNEDWGTFWTSTCNTHPSLV